MREAIQQAQGGGEGHLRGHPRQGADDGQGDHRRVADPERRRRSSGSPWATGTEYAPEISFDFGQRIGGPSAGLVFALAIYDKITAGPLLDGQHVAGTGTITPDGRGRPDRRHPGEDRRRGEGRRDRLPGPGGQLSAISPGCSTDLTLIKVSTLRGRDHRHRDAEPLRRAPASCRAADGGPRESSRRRWWPRCWNWTAISAEAGWDQPAAAVRPGADRRARRAPSRGWRRAGPADHRGRRPAGRADRDRAGGVRPGRRPADRPRRHRVAGLGVRLRAQHRTHLPAGGVRGGPARGPGRGGRRWSRATRSARRSGSWSGVDRAGNRHGVARLASRPDELLGAQDLVPGLAAALAHTLA